MILKGKLRRQKKDYKRISDHKTMGIPIVKEKERLCVYFTKSEITQLSLNHGSTK